MDRRAELVHGEMDARKWACEFKKINPDGPDEDVMIGWFANAIMSGWDAAHWKMERQQRDASPLDWVRKWWRVMTHEYEPAGFGWWTR